MRSFLALTLLAVGASTAAALAVPAMSEIEVMKRNIIDRQKLRKRQLVTSGADDATILNFALTLEHLEAKFYADAIAKYNETSFASAGFGGLYPVLEQVGRDETAHVEFLTTALKAAGVTPVQACNYTFPYTDVASFLALSQVIEGVGVSAYLGAAGDINNTQYLTAAGSILTVEARHAAAIQLINGYQPASQPFDTPLDAASVVTLVSPFFKSCPTGSAPTIEGNPALNVTTTMPEFGGSLSVTPANSSVLHSGSNVYCGFASGLALEFTPYSTSNYSCPIPHSGNITAGQTYVVLTTNNTASSIIAGPAIVILGQEKNLTFSINNTATASHNSSSSSGGSKASQGSSAAAVSGGSNGAGALHVGGAAGVLAAVVGGLAVLL